MANEIPETEELLIKTEKADEGRTKIDVFYGNKLKRSCEMVITEEFLKSSLEYVEHFLDTMLFCNYEGIRFEDYKDEYKSFNLVLNPCDMRVFNDYYGTIFAEHRADVTLRWKKGPEAKRPSQSIMNGTKKQVTKAVYEFIKSMNTKIKSEMLESLLDTDLYDYYQRIV